MARQRRQRSEQEFLPGTAPVKNDRIHKHAKRYAQLRDDRMAANKEEKEAHDTLLAIMAELGVDAYEYGDVKVFVDKKQKVKVSVGGSDTNGEKEEEE